jgi:hypothetical protein
MLPLCNIFLNFVGFRRLKEPFLKAWAETLGLQYSNNPIALSDTALSSLPTIILQLKGDDTSNAELFSRFPTSPQWAVHVDPDRPLDVLVAIPPSHYMEYQEDIEMYVPGIYFEEAEGSVIGSNVMLMHDVFFDVEHERIGWAKSSCDYAKLISPFVKDSDTALLVEQPLVQSSDTAVLDWKYLPYGPFVSGFCRSATCRVSVIAGLVLSFLAVLTLASHRGKRRRRRQRIHLALSPLRPLQRNGSRTVPRSASHSISMGPNKMAPGRSQSPSVIAVFMSSVMTTRHPSSTTSSDSDHLQIPLGAMNESRATDFMGNGFRPGSLLRSRSRDVSSY